MKTSPIIALFFAFILIFPAFAQDEVGFWTLYGHISMPQGDFGDDSGPGSGLAVTGFGAGVEYSIPAGSKGLYYLLNANFLWNGLDDTELKAVLQELYQGMDFGLDTGSWKNIQVLCGLKYQNALSSTLDFYGIGSVGMNIAKPPTIELTLMGMTGEESYQTTTSFGFCLGCGIVIKKKVNVGIRYLGLGEPEMKGEVKIGNETESIDTFDQAISILLISVGLQF